MTRADERKHTSTSTGTPVDVIAIYPRPIWSDGEVDVDQAARWIEGNVPAVGWQELATGFLERLNK
jgi:hypothetical protein